MRPRCRIGKHQGDRSQLWRFNSALGPPLVRHWSDRRCQTHTTASPFRQIRAGPGRARLTLRRENSVAVHLKGLAVAGAALWVEWPVKAANIPKVRICRNAMTNTAQTCAIRTLPVWRQMAMIPLIIIVYDLFAGSNAKRNVPSGGNVLVCLQFDSD